MDRLPSETVRALADRARSLSNDLFGSDVPCTNIKDERSCIMQEEDRPLTREEKRHDWTRRPFWAYDTDKMCRGCRIYFFAERAAQELHEAACWAVRIEADEARKASQS